MDDKHKKFIQIISDSKDSEDAGAVSLISKIKEMVNAKEMREHRLNVRELMRIAQETDYETLLVAFKKEVIEKGIDKNDTSEALAKALYKAFLFTHSVPRNERRCANG